MTFKVGLVERSTVNGGRYVRRIRRYQWKRPSLVYRGNK